MSACLGSCGGHGGVFPILACRTARPSDEPRACAGCLYFDGMLCTIYPSSGFPDKPTTCPDFQPARPVH